MISFPLVLIDGNAFEWLDHHMVPVILPVLLVMDLVMLRFARRERQERKEHISALDANINEIKGSTETLTRRDYEQEIIRGLRGAEKRIYCYWHSLHPVGESEAYKEINEQLIEKHKEGVDVRLVVAGEPSRIAPAFELVKGDVPVLFKNSLVVSDLRFSIFDDKLTVLGVPESAVKDGKPSRHGVDISSRKLNALLAQHFEAELSKKTEGFFDFVAYQCRDVLAEDPTNTVPMIADQLGIPKCVVTYACSQARASDDAAAPENAED
jgi:hypothetical protein